MRVFSLAITALAFVLLPLGAAFIAPIDPPPWQVIKSTYADDAEAMVESSDLSRRSHTLASGQSSLNEAARVDLPVRLLPIAAFGDWAAACDNGHHCEAGVGIDGGGGLRISREAGPNGQAWIRLFPSHNRPQRIPAGTYFVSTDRGQRLAIHQRPRADEYLGIRFRLDHREMAALRRASQLRLITMNGEVLAEAPLPGIVDVAELTDAVQGRVGTVTALAQPGQRPASTVPAPPPLAIRTRARSSARPPAWPSDAQIARIHRTNDCQTHPLNDGEAIRLDATHTVYTYWCWFGSSGGASAIWVGTDHDPQTIWQPAILDHPMYEDPQDANMLYFGSWSHEHKTLTFFSNAVMGVCGNSGSYIWDGARFRLVDYADSSPDCSRGAGGGEPLPLWRAIVR
jgi:hypothetical protein